VGYAPVLEAQARVSEPQVIQAVLACLQGTGRSRSPQLAP
jgi:hypothetical protein